MHESTDSSLLTSRVLSFTPDNSSAIPRNDSAVFGRRAVAMTFQPVAASARMVASPMPLLAPVTTATDGISLRSPSLGLSWRLCVYCWIRTPLAEPLGAFTYMASRSEPRFWSNSGPCSRPRS
jgi:hypothetical protein